MIVAKELLDAHSALGKRKNASARKELVIWKRVGIVGGRQDGRITSSTWLFCPKVVLNQKLFAAASEASSRRVPWQLGERVPAAQTARAIHHQIPKLRTRGGRCSRKKQVRALCLNAFFLAANKRPDCYAAFAVYYPSGWCLGSDRGM